MIPIFSRIRLQLLKSVCSINICHFQFPNFDHKFVICSFKILIYEFLIESDHNSQIRLSFWWKILHLTPTRSTCTDIHQSRITISKFVCRTNITICNFPILPIYLLLVTLKILRYQFWAESDHNCQNPCVINIAILIYSIWTTNLFFVTFKILETDFQSNRIIIAKISLLY